MFDQNTRSPARFSTRFPTQVFRRARLPQAILLVCLGGAVALPTFAQTPAGVQEEAVITFDIPAGSLDQALNSFAAATGVMLAIDGTKTKNLTSIVDPSVQTNICLV